MLCDFTQSSVTSGFTKFLPKVRLRSFLPLYRFTKLFANFPPPTFTKFLRKFFTKFLRSFYEDFAEFGSYEQPKSDVFCRFWSIFTHFWGFFDPNPLTLKNGGEEEDGGDGDGLMWRWCGDGEMVWDDTHSPKSSPNNPRNITKDVFCKSKPVEAVFFFHQIITDGGGWWWCGWDLSDDGDDLEMVMMSEEMRRINKQIQTLHKSLQTQLNQTSIEYIDLNTYVNQINNLKIAKNTLYLEEL